MKLIDIRTMRWRVLAACDNRGDCPTLEILADANSKAAKRMLNRLRQKVPESGPEFRNDEKVKPLGDGIFEFREQPKKGPKPRVYFFCDGSNIVVCTGAFMKRNERISGYIEEAKNIREKYLADKMANDIEIESFEI